MPELTDDLAFAPEETAGVLRHMNGDHPEDALLICRALGGVPSATAAVTTGVDRAGIDFRASADGSEVPVRIEWGRVLQSRAEVRGEVVRLYHEACAALGVVPRGADGATH